MKDCEKCGWPSWSQTERAFEEVAPTPHNPPDDCIEALKRRIEELRKEAGEFEENWERALKYLEKGRKSLLDCLCRFEVGRSFHYSLAVHDCIEVFEKATGCRKA